MTNDSFAYDSLCVSLVESGWQGRSRQRDAWKLEHVRVEITRDGATTVETYEYPQAEGVVVPCRPLRSERTAMIAIFIADIVKKYGVNGWVVGKGTLCDFSDAGAAAAGLKVNTLKWRRKQVYSICLKGVNQRADSRACGSPIYEHGMEYCSLHSKRATRAAQEREEKRAREREEKLAREAIAAETARVRGIVDAAFAAATSKVGYPDDSVHAYVYARDYRSAVDINAEVTIPLGVLLKMCAALTGETYDITPPPPPPSPSQQQDQQPEAITIGDIASPF